MGADGRHLRGQLAVVKTNAGNLTCTNRLKFEFAGGTDTNCAYVVQVTVDSFPGRIFEGEVIQIGDEPEFTPRNVATGEGRRTTVFAIELAVDDPAGLLKPGMPADVTFGE